MITPTENMSTLHPYPKLLRISGATYPGDPHLVNYGPSLHVVERPKSIITREFKLSSLKIKFSGFKSLCTISFECRTTSAFRIHFKIVAASISL